MFELSGSRSSANARALWRFHDRRWQEKKATDGDRAEPTRDDDESDEEETIDDEIDRRIGDPFEFRRAVGVAIECLETAQDVLRQRKTEMETWADAEGAAFVETFLQKYKDEVAMWRSIDGRLAICSTTLGESFLDSSLLHGWV